MFVSKLRVNAASLRRNWRRQCSVTVYVTVAVITPPVLLRNINARRHAITLSRLLCLAALFAGVQINGAYVLTIDVKLTGGRETARISTFPPLDIPLRTVPPGLCDILFASQ